MTEPKSGDRRWIFFLLLISMFVIDQAIKNWVAGHMHQGQSIRWPWPGVLELELTHNQGIAFGIAQGKGWVFTPVALAISIGAGWYSTRHPRESYWMHSAMALLASGAIGNLYDRIVLGYVRDMFVTRFVSFPVFNWADTCITFATIILILVWTKEAVDAKVKPHPVQAKADEPST